MRGKEQKTFCQRFLFRLMSLILLGLTSNAYSLGAESLKLSGTVTDPAGAVLPGATVAIQGKDADSARQNVQRMRMVNSSC